METSFDPLPRDRWARLRFAIIGPLLVAPPEARALHAVLAELAARRWRHPISGQDVQFGHSTIERWYYSARRAADPVATLRNRLRPHGRFASLAPTVIETLREQYRAHPGWTAQLHADNLRAAFVGTRQHVPSYQTIRRYLKAHGLTRQTRPKRTSDGARAAVERLERLEVRSFELDHVSALWHLDFHHGSRRILTAAGTWEKPFLLCILDDRSRLVCHLQWYLGETAQSLVHGLTQAFMKRGLPRALMTDNGAAMLADETVSGLDRLGVLHQTTLPYSPYQNAKQESFWGRIEGRLMPMLEGEPALTLELLNRATQAWVEQEYHRSEHSELGASPLARYLAGPNVRRDCPEARVLADAFRIEVARRQRRSDGTVTVQGQRFEIPSRYGHLAVVHLRYARWNLTRVDLVEPRSGTTLAPIMPLDKSANANAERRPRAGAVIDMTPTPPAGIAPLLTQLLAEYAATGLPPAYLPTDTSDEESA